MLPFSLVSSTNKHLGYNHIHTFPGVNPIGHSRIYFWINVKGLSSWWLTEPYCFSKLNRFMSKRLMCFLHICINQRLNWELDFPVLAKYVHYKLFMWELKITCSEGWHVFGTDWCQRLQHSLAHWTFTAVLINTYLSVTLRGVTENCTVLKNENSKIRPLIFLLLFGISWLLVLRAVLGWPHNCNTQGKGRMTVG